MDSKYGEEAVDRLQLHASLPAQHTPDTLPSSDKNDTAIASNTTSAVSSLLYYKGQLYSVVPGGIDKVKGAAKSGANTIAEAKDTVSTSADVAQAMAAAGINVVEHATANAPSSVTTAAQRAIQRRARGGIIYSGDSSDEEDERGDMGKKNRKERKKTGEGYLHTPTSTIARRDQQHNKDSPHGNLGTSPFNHLNDSLDKGTIEINDSDDTMTTTNESKTKKFYQKRRFWSISISILITCAFIAAGTVLVVDNKQLVTARFQSWRLCFFIAGLPVIWWVGHGVSYGIVWAVEKSMFSVKNALYIAYAVRVRLCIVEREIFFFNPLFPFPIPILN